MRPDVDQKPSLLIFAQWFTPGYKAGGPIRSIQNLVDLLKNDFQIFVITADRDHGDDTAYSGVILNKWIDQSGYSVFYADKKHLTYSIFKKIIEEIKPGTVFLNSMFAYRFFLLPLIALRQIQFDGKIILAPRGMLRVSALRFKKWKKKLFLSILRNTNLLKEIQYQATNEDESKEIQNILRVSPTKIHIVENVPFAGGEEKIIEKKPGELKLIYLGRIHPIKGLEFILDVLQHVNEPVALEIVGSIENKEYFELCKSKMISLPSNIKIKWKEDMPFEKAIERVYKNHFLVSPTHGENFGHAIFDALSVGRPVIISDQTPWRDLEDKGIGWDISLNDALKFKTAIQQAAAMDQDEYDQYCKRAKEFSRNYILNGNLKEKYHQLFRATKLVNQH